MNPEAKRVVDEIRAKRERQSGNPDTQRVLDEIRAERGRQIGEEGWTREHDDAHSRGEMAAAAAVISLHTVEVPSSMKDDVTRVRRFFWPWEERWWKPKSRRRDLVRAAALLVAEIERIDRATLARMSARFKEPGVVVHPKAEERAP